LNAAKKIILLLWLLIAASLGNASALTPGATGNRVWQKSFETLETRQAEPLQTLGGHQENEGASYDYAVDSLLAAETTAANTPLALGLTDSGLAEFAQARGATIATGENWQSTVLNGLADPNTMVHFNLNGVDVWPGVQRAASGLGGPTDWELLQIQQSPQSWSTLQFWKGGQPVANPFK
jgi:hypothetical protein